MTLHNHFRNAQCVAETFIHLAKTQSMSSSLIDVFPRDMESLVLLTLDVPVEYRQDLTLFDAEQYLCALRDVPYTPGVDADRELFGMLCIGFPVTLILVNASLNARVRNYVIAHEVAHFLVDIFTVRKLWFESLHHREYEVSRAFSWSNDSSWIELQAFVNGLPRRAKAITARGTAQRPETHEKEFEADMVARELLFPSEQAIRRFHKLRTKAHFIRCAREEYGLPLQVANAYYDDINLMLAPRPNFFGDLFRL